MSSRKLWVGIALGFVAGVAVTTILVREYGSGGFLTDTVNTVTRPPFTATKLLFYLCALLVAVALPIGLLEWRAERRFLRLEREMRAARPADAVTAYDGPEGRGFVFDGPSGRTLLLEGEGGVGAPRVVDLPPVVAAPEPPGVAAEP